MTTKEFIELRQRLETFAEKAGKGQVVTRTFKSWPKAASGLVQYGW